MVRRLLLLSALATVLAQTLPAQSAKPKADGGGSAQMSRITLSADLQGLEAEAAKLDSPLAQALAKSEIADALWHLDEERAKSLLREACELTFPAEEEQLKLRNRATGAIPAQWTEDELAQNAVRARVLAVAGRDKELASELTLLSARHMGNYEKQYRYSSLAEGALQAGETDAAGNYILRSIEADPTQINAGLSILKLAQRDRRAADRLTIQYMEQLRSLPLSLANQSAFRVFFVLQPLVFPASSADPEWQRVPPPDPSVVKAYVAFVLYSLSKLEASEPGSSRVLRHVLLSTWLPLNRLAPELVPAFMSLEQLSRRPGEDAPLPRPGDRDSRQSSYDERIKQALSGGSPNEMTIQFAIGRDDFANARKLIDMVTDEGRKAELLESVNAREAVSLASKEDPAEAERMAQRLTRAASISQAYPPLIERCVKKGDAACAPRLIYEAMKQLKRSPDQSAAASALTRIAKAVAPANAALAFEVLDEAVRAANSAPAPDARQSLTRMDAAAFQLLAPKDEVRARQAAEALKERLPRILALAAICQWKAKSITKDSKAGDKTTGS